MLKNKVKTFSIRNNKLTILQAKFIRKYWKTTCIDFSLTRTPFSIFFKNTLPIVVEIGFGAGTSLIEMARNDTNCNFVGIEVYIPSVASCINTINKLKIKNLKIINHDAIEVFDFMIPNNTLYKVQIFFPDVWCKNKHKKRRLLQKPFIILMLSKLTKNGILHITTDCRNYAKNILKIMDSINECLNLSENNMFIDRPTLRPYTEFELRGKLLGHNIFDLMFKKIN